MKAYKIIGLICTLAFSFTACNKNDKNENLTMNVKLFSGVNQYETRINNEGDKWSEGDEIGVFMTENNSSIVVNGSRNIAYKAQNSASATPFIPSNTGQVISYPDGSGTVDFIAYYPYKTSAESFIYPVSISNQATSFTKHDLLYAISTNHDDRNVENITLSFTHQLAKLKMNLVLEDELTEISSVTIHSINTSSFNLKTGVLEDKGEISSIIPYKTENNIYEAILIPAELSELNKVVFKINGASYEWKMLENDALITSIDKNKSYTFNITIKNNTVDAQLVTIDNGSMSPWEEQNSSGSAEKVPGSEESDKLPDPVYFNTFDNTGGLNIIGNGSFITDTDERFGKVFQNATGGMRENYLLLPPEILSHSKTTQEMSIGMWVNAKNAGNSTTYAWCPLLTAHQVAPIDGKNTFLMFALQYRGVIQVNCAGYCNFDDEHNVTGTNVLYNNDADWLADGEWHYYTVTMTATTACVYFDGVLKNKWVIDGTSEGQVLKGLFSTGNELKYIALGGNQAWDFNDPDPGFMFDDIVVYNTALNQSQIAAIIAGK